MANFQNNAITESGIRLRSHVDMGAVFTATKIVIGSGYIPAGKTAKTMTDVVSPVKELAINKKQRSPDGKVTFGGVYTNEGVATEFYFRELALYAKAVYPDGTEVDEVLYCYGNAAASAELMAAYSTSTVVERQMDIVTFIGSEAEVDLTIESGVYMTREQVEAMLAELGPSSHAETHAIGGEDPITPAMIGAVSLENKWLQFTNYGLVGVNIDEVVNHNYCVGISEDGYGTRPPDSGWINVVNFACYHFTAQIAVSCTIGEEKDRPVKMWMREKYNGEDSGWSNWIEIANAKDFLPIIGGTLNGSLSVNHGAGTFLAWINDEETGASINAFKGDVTTRLEAIANANGGGAFLSVFKDGQWAVQELYHAGNAPAVTATAELV